MTRAGATEDSWESGIANESADIRLASKINFHFVRVADSRQRERQRKRENEREREREREKREEKRERERRRQEENIWQSSLRILEIRRNRVPLNRALRLRFTTCEQIRSHCRTKHAFG